MSDITTATDGELVLQGKSQALRAFIALLVASMGASAVATVSTNQSVILTLWFIAASFGALAVIVPIVMIRRPQRMTLSPEGFRFSAGITDVAFRWSQVRRFFVFETKPGIGPHRTVVGIEFVPGQGGIFETPMPAMAARRATGVEHSGLLQSTFGKTPDALVALLEQWRQRAAGETVIDPLAARTSAFGGEEKAMLGPEQRTLLEREATDSRRSAGIFGLAVVAGVLWVAGVWLVYPALWLSWLGPSLVMAFYAATTWLDARSQARALDADLAEGSVVKDSGPIGVPRNWFGTSNWLTQLFTKTPPGVVMTVGTARFTAILAPNVWWWLGYPSLPAAFRKVGNGMAAHTPTAHRVLRVEDASGQVIYDATTTASRPASLGSAILVGALVALIGGTVYLNQPVAIPDYHADPEPADGMRFALAGPSTGPRATDDSSSQESYVTGGLQVRLKIVDYTIRFGAPLRITAQGERVEADVTFVPVTPSRLRENDIPYAGVYCGSAKGATSGLPRYILGIDPDGGPIIVRVLGTSDGAVSGLARSGPAAVVSRTGVNHVQADCLGSEKGEVLVLTVNGSRILQTIDTSPERLTVIDSAGVETLSGSQAGFTVVFANLQGTPMLPGR